MKTKTKYILIIVFLLLGLLQLLFDFGVLVNSGIIASIRDGILNLNFWVKLTPFWAIEILILYLLKHISKIIVALPTYAKYLIFILATGIVLYLSYSNHRLFWSANPIISYLNVRSFMVLIFLIILIMKVGDEMDDVQDYKINI